MRFGILFLFSICFLLPLSAQEKYQDRWFYASGGLQSDQKAEELISLIHKASEKDLNAVLWACGLENCGKWSPNLVARFNKIKAEADASKIEIVPVIWSVGYGSMIGWDPNLVEGQEVKDVPMIAEKGKIVFNSSEDKNLKNGDMEIASGKYAVKEFSQDMPGKISFIDHDVKYGGNSSVRFENFSLDKHGHGRLTRVLDLLPNRPYVLKIRYKTENLVKGNFLFQIYTMSGRQLIAIRPKLPENGTKDWSEQILFFNSGEEGKLRFYAGIWKGVSGKFWFDDLSVQQLGLVNPIVRKGTPISVRNKKTGHLYRSGIDYDLPKKYRLQPRSVKTDSLALDIPKTSEISEGTELLVNYYQPIRIGDNQMSVCMSEPELYEMFSRSARDIKKLLNPKKWFLSMDEVRAGGTCRACRDRKTDMGTILGDCITKQYKIIRSVSPDAQVYIWSDMLDPNHNCHANYFSCEGDFSGVWNKIPKDLIISCWYHKIREKSMEFFSKNGFRTQAAAYYDADTLEGCEQWLETCNKTPGCTGIMYTTWRNKYDLLAPFGDLVQKKSKPCLTDLPRTPLLRSAPEWLENGVMYQINLRSYTPEGTIKAAEQKLDDLAKLEVSIVYLCPFFAADDDQNREFWTPRQKASGLNNPKNLYRIKDYYKIDPEFGSDKDLKKYIEKAHSLGMKVLFDVVYLHCGPSAVFIKDHPNFVKRDSNGKILNSEWKFPEINFEDKELRRYLIDNMLYWIREFGVDGFRCDAVTHTPLDFWEEARGELEKANPDIVLLAEGEKAGYMRKAFDICYSYSLYSCLKDQSALKTVKKFQNFQSGRYIRFLDQHDIANNDMNNRVEKRIGSDKINAFFVLGYMLPGVPMLYCGQEVCDMNRHSIFSHAPLDSSGNIVGDPLIIDWKSGDTPAGKKRGELLASLGKIRKDYSDLIRGEMKWLSNSKPKEILSFTRKSGDRVILVLINISDHVSLFSVDNTSSFRKVLIQNGKIRKDQYELPPFGWLILAQ